MTVSPSIQPPSPAPTLSVVVPLYNEEQGVQELLERLRQSCQGIGESYELVMVNDGSSDQTLARLVGFSQGIPELRVVDLYRNFGHMAALDAGLKMARGRAVVVMDGDLQDPPELIPELVAQWRKGHDCVYVRRARRHEHVLKRVLTAGFYWLLDRVSEHPIPKQVGTYGLLDRQLLDNLLAMPEKQRYFAGLRAWIGGRQAFVEAERPDRRHGSSRVGAAGLMRLARTALFSFSKKPLRLAVCLSLVSGSVLLVVGLSAIAIRLFTDLAIPGWATYTTMLGMMGFTQSLVLAIMAEYLAIVFDEVKRRPVSVVREEVAAGTGVGPVDQEEPTV